MGIMQQGPNWLPFTHRKPETTLCQHPIATLPSPITCVWKNAATVSVIQKQRDWLLGFVLCFRVLSRCLSSSSEGSPSVLLEHCFVLCSVYKVSQPAPCWHFTHALGYLYQNPTLILCFFPIWFLAATPFLTVECGILCSLESCI